MVFVDGENLVCRYQAMLKKGFVPRDELYHERDVAVWFPRFTLLGREHEILRTTYYTYVVGDDDRIATIENEIKNLRFDKHRASRLPDTVSPCVFKKNSKAKSGKGVDIKLCVDVLTHVYHGNTDAILLLSGDGDYEPLLSEVLRNGVQVYVSAFSDGLNPRLVRLADRTYELDGTTWKERPTDT